MEQHWWRLWLGGGLAGALVALICTLAIIRHTSAVIAQAMETARGEYETIHARLSALSMRIDAVEAELTALVNTVAGEG